MRSPSRSRADARIARTSLLLESSSPRARRRPSPPWWSACRALGEVSSSARGTELASQWTPCGTRGAATARRRCEGAVAETRIRRAWFLVRTRARDEIRSVSSSSKLRAQARCGMFSRLLSGDPASSRSRNQRPHSDERTRHAFPGPWPPRLPTRATRPDRKPRRCVSFAESQRVATEAATDGRPPSELPNWARIELRLRTTGWATRIAT